MERRKHWLALGLVLLLLLALRLYGINNSPFEAGEYWRQPDTESIALTFLHYRFDWLRPSFYYDGPFPNVVALELQVLTPIIALLYRAFGEHYFLARGASIACFLGSCGFLWGIARRYMSEAGAIWAVLLYGLLPVNLWVSRTIQPEPAAMFFYVGAVYCFQRYAEADRKPDGWLVLAGLFAAVAIMQKPQTALIALPLLGLAWQRDRWRMLLRRPLWLFAVFVLGVPALYYLYSNHVAEFRFAQGITAKHVLPEFLTAFRTEQALTFFRTQIPQALTIPGLAVLAVALVDVRKRLGIIYLWLAGVVFYLLTVGAVIRFYYYLIYITPPLAILMGSLLSRFTRWAAVVPLVAAAVVGVTGFKLVQPWYVQRNDIITQGQIVQQVTAPGDLIVTPTNAPALIDASERQGWRYQLHYYPYIPNDPYAELQYYIDHGAKWFIPLHGVIEGDARGEIARYLDQHYQRVEPKPGYVIYKLR